MAENRANYSTEQFERAKLALQLYHNIGAPGEGNFKAIIKSRWTTKKPVTEVDIKRAIDIWGLRYFLFERTSIWSNGFLKSVCRTSMVFSCSFWYVSHAVAAMMMMMFQ